MKHLTLWKFLRTVRDSKPTVPALTRTSFSSTASYCCLQGYTQNNRSTVRTRTTTIRRLIDLKFYPNQEPPIASNARSEGPMHIQHVMPTLPYVLPRNRVSISSRGKTFVPSPKKHTNTHTVYAICGILNDIVSGGTSTSYCDVRVYCTRRRWSEKDFIPY
jgi:hypothetical protein